MEVETDAAVFDSCNKSVGYCDTLSVCSADH